MQSKALLSSLFTLCPYNTEYGRSANGTWHKKCCWCVARISLHPWPKFEVVLLYQPAIWCSRLCVARYVLARSFTDAQATFDDIERKTFRMNLWRLLGLSTMHHMPANGIAMGPHELQLIKCPRHFPAPPRWSALRRLRPLCS